MTVHIYQLPVIILQYQQHAVHLITVTSDSGIRTSTSATQCSFLHLLYSVLSICLCYRTYIFLCVLSSTCLLRTSTTLPVSSFNFVSTSTTLPVFSFNIMTISKTLPVSSFIIVSIYILFRYPVSSLCHYIPAFYNRC